MYHQAMRANEERIIDEYSSIDEGYDEIDNKEVVDAAVSISTGEIQESCDRSIIILLFKKKGIIMKMILMKMV